MNSLYWVLLAVVGVALLVFFTRRSSAIRRDAPAREINAQRFAKLLVAEIKLYHEQEVESGRRNKDLYRRLKEEIDRARQIYDTKVGPETAARTDYFHEELVKELAGGDVSKLGEGYEAQRSTEI